MGYDKSTIAMQGLGYKEILSYLRGERSLDEAVEILKRDTRRYAKRQRSEEHTSELQSRPHLVCRLLLEKKKLQAAHSATPGARMALTRSPTASARGPIDRPGVSAAPCTSNAPRHMSALICAGAGGIVA